MNDILPTFKIAVNDGIYLKDPETSDLGKKIIRESILLIDEIGFEDFTFRKLGARINSNESSIYRYFESKHKLMLYLSAWYWGWIEYKMILATTNIVDPEQQLLRAIGVVTEKIDDDTQTLHIDESVLNKIIITEFGKNLITKSVDQENKEGFFVVYKRVINRLVESIRAVNPDYPFPKSLASAVVEGSLHQHFLRQHLKTITDCLGEVSVAYFYTHLVLKIIKN